MNRRQNAHRRNTLDKIMEIMRANQGVWMTSNTVATKMKISQTRTVGKHMRFLSSYVDGLEMRIESRTNYRVFRYIRPEEPPVDLPEPEDKKRILGSASQSCKDESCCTETCDDTEDRRR